MAGPRTSTFAGRRVGFTFVELLVVISIICLLMGLIVGGIVVAQRRAQVMRTQAVIDTLRSECERFRGNHGCYPWTSPEKVTPATVIDSAEVYAELRGLPGAAINKSTDYLTGLSPRFVKTVSGKDRLQDAWGSDIGFRVNPQGLTPVIWSRGRNRVDDTNFEDPPASYTGYSPPAPPAAYSNPLKYPRTYYYLGDGRSRDDDRSSL